LEETVHASGGDPGQIKGGGAGTAQAGGGFGDGLEHAEIGIQVLDLVGAEGKTGADQGAGQTGALADPDTAAVERRAAAAAGGEFLIAQWIVDHRVLDPAFDGQSNGNAILRKTVD